MKPMGEAHQKYELSELIRRFMGTWIEGNVCSQKSGMVQVNIGGGVKTAFLPVVQIRAGTMKIETMPAIGEQVTVFFPCGDESRGRVIGALFGGSYTATGALSDELLIAGRRVRISADVEIVGNVTVTGNIAIEDGDIVADSVSLKNHTHPGDSGGDTGPPN